MQITDLRHGKLAIDSLLLPAAGGLAVVGPNGSGKSLLAALLSGQLEPEHGTLSSVPGQRVLVSSETSQARYERELAEEETDFSDEVDFGATGLELLLEAAQGEAEVRETASALGLAHLLERGCRQFSSGEWRRIELGRAFLAEPELLLLDEPFESLDRSAREEMLKLAEQLHLRGVQIVFFVSRIEDAPEFLQTWLVLDQGRVLRLGSKRELLSDAKVRQLLSGDAGLTPELALASPQYISPLIDGRGLTVRYGELVQFAPFDWKVEPFEHTRITGPNGSGKSTLLGLLTGDHPQCYRNQLSVVGYKRGSGESIWDVKKRIGIVSPALHRDYRAPATALSTVTSGFFDSIGLYQEPLKDQVRAARHWLDVFELGASAERAFRELSHGEQRLILIARALVKLPPLLVLDEPTAGLDAANSCLVLRATERLIELQLTTVLFISHRIDERIVGMNRVLEFVPSLSPDVRYEVHLQTGCPSGPAEP